MYVMSALLLFACSEYEFANLGDGGTGSEDNQWDAWGDHDDDANGNGSWDDPITEYGEPGDDTLEIPRNNPYEPPPEEPNGFDDDDDDDDSDWNPDPWYEGGGSFPDLEPGDSDDSDGGDGGDNGGDTRKPGRMTGGGLISDGNDYHYGFTLHCDENHHANNLQMTFGVRSFHLESIGWIHCSENPDLEPGQPTVGHNTLEGVAYGRNQNGRDAEIWFRFEDDGEPGTTDHLAFTMVVGQQAITGTGFLVSGNHQAHNPVKK